MKASVRSLPIPARPSSKGLWIPRAGSVTRLAALALLLLAGAGAVVLSAGEDSKSREQAVTEKGKASGEEKSAKKEKEKDKEQKAPSHYLEFGFLERARPELWDNLDMDSRVEDSRTQLRFKTRAWMSAVLPGQWKADVALVNEFRKIFTPDTPMTADEVVIDSLSLEKTNLVKGVSVKVGRQDIVRGEGFIIQDGTAYDGSRTFYFNAVVGTIAVGKSKLELLAIYTPIEDDLPVINNQHRKVSDQNNDALGLYFTAGNPSRVELQSYYFFKHVYNCIFPRTNRFYLPNRSVHTAGGRLAVNWGRGWTSAAELALQAGSMATGPDIRAWGGYAWASKAFRHKWKPYVKVAWYAMSGDDPSTPEWEGWDPPFSRWPKWGEYLTYAMTTERGIAYFTNMHFGTLEAGFSPYKNLKITASVSRQYAFHPYLGNPAYIANGKVRGVYFLAKAEFVLSKNFKGHLLYERFLPGSYFRGDDAGYFFRAEIIYTFSHRVRLD